MGQQTYIKTGACERIHKLGYITASEFNTFINSAIIERIEHDEKSQQ